MPASVICFVLFLFFFFKQKTAYEIMPSLVGSEMCIRDRGVLRRVGRLDPRDPRLRRGGRAPDDPERGLRSNGPLGCARGKGDAEAVVLERIVDRRAELDPPAPLDEAHDG